MGTSKRPKLELVSGLLLFYSACQLLLGTYLESLGKLSGAVVIATKTDVVPSGNFRDVEDVLDDGVDIRRVWVIDVHEGSHESDHDNTVVFGNSLEDIIWDVAQML